VVWATTQTDMIAGVLGAGGGANIWTAESGLVTVSYSTVNVASVIGNTDPATAAGYPGTNSRAGLCVK